MHHNIPFKVYINCVAGASLSEVMVAGKVITRDGLCNNERVLTHSINHLGSRVGVDVLAMHLQSLYDFMTIPIDST